MGEDSGGAGFADDNFDIGCECGLRKEKPFYYFLLVIILPFIFIYIYNNHSRCFIMFHRETPSFSTTYFRLPLRDAVNRTTATDIAT